MTVFNKEYYTQLDGAEVIKAILKPTKVFPEGSNYFYAPREAESLIDAYTWSLIKQGKNRVVVIARKTDWGTRKTLLFHKELFKFYHDYDCQDDIDHLNMLEFDNTDQNLNAVTTQQNQFNRLTKGYFYHKDWSHFQAYYGLNSKLCYPFSINHREDEA